MAMEMRAQGRPPRGDGKVGRTRLLDRTRDALKSKPKIDIQRREVAIFAGVTPALVSYYYPDKWDLFAAAARPVIESYIEETRAIIQSEAAPGEKLCSIIRLYIEFNSKQGYLLDFYIENSERMARKEDLRALHEVHGEILSFFERLLADGLVRGENPAFIQSSLWGLCKYVAQQAHLADPAPSPEREFVMNAMTDSVCDLFLHGAATSRLALA